MKFAAVVSAVLVASAAAFAPAATEVRLGFINDVGVGWVDQNGGSQGENFGQNCLGPI